MKIHLKKWQKIILLIIGVYLLLCVASMGYLLTYYKDAKNIRCTFLGICKDYTFDINKVKPRVCTADEVTRIKSDPRIDLNLNCQIGYSGPLGILTEKKIQRKVFVFLVSPVVIFKLFIIDEFKILFIDV